MEGNLELGHLVGHIVGVVVEVLLEEVDYERDMWRAVQHLELVAGEFGHDDGVLVELLNDIKEWDADIAGQDAAGDEVGDEAGGGGLALGAGDADGEVGVDLEEKVGEAR